MKPHASLKENFTKRFTCGGGGFSPGVRSRRIARRIETRFAGLAAGWAAAATGLAVATQAWAAETNALEAVRAGLRSSQSLQGAVRAGQPSRATTNPRAAAVAAKLGAWLAPAAGVSLASTGAAQARQQALQTLHASAGADAVVHWRPENQTVRQISGRVLEPSAAAVALASGGSRAERTARAFLRRQRSLLRLADPDNELKLVEESRDELGYRHLHFTQLYRGLAVWPAALSVHLDAAGNVHLLDGAYVPTPAPLSLQPAIDATTAVQMALAGLPGEGASAAGRPELVIYAPLDQALRLGWKLDASEGLGHAWRIVVDAQDGRLLSRETRCPDGSVAGSGKDMDGLTQSLNVWQQSSTNYYLIDTTKPMYQAGFDPVKDPHGAIRVVDAQDATLEQVNSNGVFFVSSANPNNWVVPESVSALVNVGRTYDYYLERHNRNSIDGQGGTLTALVRVAQLDNAFWNDQAKIMVFGTVQPYAKALDVIGHEMTHGITAATAGLKYENQSGALNEAFSDIFGEMVEARATGQTDWLLGTGLPEVIRNMRDPGSITIAGLNRPYPSKMSEFIQLPNTDNADHGGVHLNSSIINRAFYLFAAGQANAVGLRDAERVFYRCDTQHLQPQSQFVDARLGCVASAEELFGQGSTQAVAVAQAFDAVEIYEAPKAPEPSPIPAVQGQDSTVFIYFDTSVFAYGVGRREAARGDGNQGSTLAGPAQLARPSVSGDGTLAVFVDSTYDLGAVATANASTEQRLGFPGEVHSVAVSPNQRFYAFVLRNPFTGQADNQINVFDLSSNQVHTYNLVVPVVDAAPVDNVFYADSMVFSSDSQTLIYDAVSQLRFASVGTVQRWSIFGLNLATEKTSTIVPPLETLDTGNPFLGRAGTRYLSFEAIDTQSNDSTILNMDLFTGDVHAIGTVSGGLGYPCFNGDETAVIYTKEDATAFSGFSLVRQALAADRLTPVGTPTVWLRDALVGCIYRRGTFIQSNALPQVTITSPAAGSSFPAPATVAVSVNASDSDGQVAKVEFYQGATKLGERTAAPYTLTWSNVTAGTYRLVARAIDNLGGTMDSTPVAITVGPVNETLRITSWRLVSATEFELVFSSQIGQAHRIEVSTDLRSWSPLTNVVATTASTTFRDAFSGVATRFYRVALGAAAVTLPVISAPPANQTVAAGTSATFTVVASGTDLRYQWRKDGQILVGQTNATLSLTNVTIAQTGAYTVEVSNGAGTVTSAATLTVSGASAAATLPQVGVVYPAGTEIGGSLFGVQFTIPPTWKGALQQGTPLMLFVSDTYTNIPITCVVGFGGDQNFYLQDPTLLGGFQITLGNDKVSFAVVKPLSAVAANRITAMYQGIGSVTATSYYAAIDISVHPSGGGVMYVGFSVAGKQDQMVAQMKVFGDSVRSTPRPTDATFMQRLNGRSFYWAGGGNDWYSNQSGFYTRDGALSDWSENYAYFCAQGTFDVNKTTTTYASSTSASGEFSSLSGSSTSTESGQWTVVQDAQYGDLILMVTLSGYQVVPIKFDVDGSLLVGPNRLSPHGTFDCH